MRVLPLRQIPRQLLDLRRSLFLLRKEQITRLSREKRERKHLSRKKERDLAYPQSLFPLVNSSPATPVLGSSPEELPQANSTLVPPVQGSSSERKNPTRNLASRIRESAQLEELGTPSQHISGAHFDGGSSEDPPSISKQSFSLYRQLGSSSVVVFHQDVASEVPSAYTTAQEAGSPFFLVSNRKSSRKATKA
ncbi:hypothetical protein Bca52824_032816 [Brassica carinata]|uniref:Uncharacterized protein n=1 Tax=Brassica carinata TaxID=52824 RepID=A0A8X7SEW5_BRACI|nr:hypothetical protein Bca52824_032816 [Brassica carinata]